MPGSWPDPSNIHRWSVMIILPRHVCAMRSFFGYCCISGMSLLLWMNPAILVAKGGPSWHGKQDWHSLEHETQWVEINCGRDSVSSLCVSVAWHRVFFSGFVLVKGIEAWKERWWHALGCIQSFLYLKQHWIQPSTHRRLNPVLVGMEQGRNRIWQGVWMGRKGANWVCSVGFCWMLAWRSQAAWVHILTISNCETSVLNCWLSHSQGPVPRKKRFYKS